MSAPRVALAGNPNCGKTALFNAITGGRQKVGNYPGVTVERKEGSVTTPSGLSVSLLDLPGAYSLDARTPDEEITRDVLLGKVAREPAPEALVAVADATNLERNLGLVLELRKLDLPVVLALNMMDLARERGLELDLEVLSRELGVAVVPTVATKGEGIGELLRQVEDLLQIRARHAGRTAASAALSEGSAASSSSAEAVRARFAEVDRILSLATKRVARPTVWTDRIDRVVLHPVWGSLVLIALLSLIFQAIFSWASVPADAIEAGLGWLGGRVGAAMGEGPLKSLVVDGVIAGVGSVLVFLPQILLLFLFILLLEDSGYMARAAFLMDRLMGKVGLHGRAFIPLLSSYACAIPGIMATRTIENRRDRLVTILVAPLTTCSARLPVYTLLIGAFIPDRPVWGPFRLPGLVMLGLYVAGIAFALGMSVVLRKAVFRGPKPPLLMEMPTYKWPSFRSLVLGLFERARIFVRRAGTVILALSVLIWFVASYPKAPEGATEPAINYSFAGRIGHAIEPAIAPLGFNWQIGIALVPGFAAREVMVSALSTVYSVEAGKEGAPAAAAEPAPAEGQAEKALGAVLSSKWSLATALSMLAWYVIAMQCLSTLAVTRRETNSWRWPAFMLGYLTVLAYAVSFATYHVAVWAGLG